MATRQKTVSYTFLTLASLNSSATVTGLTQTTIWLPESGLSFVSVIARISCDDILTVAATSITTKTFNLRLGAATFTSITSANVLTYSGENLSLFWTADFTSHFTANWTAQASAGAATCDFQIALLQTGGTTTGFVNVSVTLDITYNYDDTSATQLKTVLIPLASPAGAIATAATTYDTIPALDTYLAEAGKTYRNIAVVVQGNTQQNAVTTDHTMTLRVGATTVTTGNYEGALASDRFFRYVWALKYAAVNNWPSTSATQTWQPTATVARVNHFQAYVIVTYEFTVSSTVTATNSVLLPMAVDSPAWGSGINNLYQRMTKDFYIEEPSPIALSRVGYYFFFDTAAAISSMGARLFTDTSTTTAYTVYTDAVATECGSDAASVTTTTFALSRGKNNLSCDIYVADLVDTVPNISGFWMLNYTSGIASTGIGSHNNTRYKVINDGFGTAAADTANKVTVSTATSIVESSYYLNSFGIEYLNFSSSVNQMLALNIKVERLTEDGGIGWVMPYNAGIQMDPECGARFFYAEAKNWFKQWPGDIRLYQNYPLLNPVTPRRWWVTTSAYAAASLLFFGGFTLIYTAHGITFPVTGTITGSSGGTVTIELFNSAGEQLLTTSRVGDGAFSIDWYDNTENVQVIAYESSTNKGVSALQVAGALNNFDIDLGSTYYAYV
jgi:hypothetical protein